MRRCDVPDIRPLKMGLSLGPAPLTAPGGGASTLFHGGTNAASGSVPHVLVQTALQDGPRLERCSTVEPKWLRIGLHLSEVVNIVCPHAPLGRGKGLLKRGWVVKRGGAVGGWGAGGWEDR